MKEERAKLVIGNVPQINDALTRALVSLDEIRDQIGRVPTREDEFPLWLRLPYFQHDSHEKVMPFVSPTVRRIKNVRPIYERTCRNRFLRSPPASQWNNDNFIRDKSQMTYQALARI